MANQVQPDTQGQGDIAALNETLAQVSKPILGDDLVLYVADIDELIEQDVNPRSMGKKMFDQLIQNIATAKKLESVPLCVRTDKGIEIISGHHRVRAARAAGVRRIFILLYKELDVSRKLAKQLAHNTISGSDDAELLRRVFEAISDISAQFEAYVDPRIFDAVPDPVRFVPLDVDMAAMSRSVLLLFLSSQHAIFHKAVAQIDQLLPKAQIDEVVIGDVDTFEEWRGALQKVRDELDIHSIPTAVAAMARLALERLDALAAEKQEADAPEVNTPEAKKYAQAVAA